MTEAAGSPAMPPVSAAAHAAQFIDEVERELRLTSLGCVDRDAALCSWRSIAQGEVLHNVPLRQSMGNPDVRRRLVRAEALSVAVDCVSRCLSSLLAELREARRSAIEADERSRHRSTLPKGDSSADRHHA